MPSFGREVFVLERVIAWMTEHWAISSAFGVLVIGWLAVSLLRPSAQRRKIEWIAATSMFAMLFGIFVNQLRNAIASDWLIGMIAFGFLSVMFTCGLLVSSYRTIGVLSGRAADTKASATN